MHPTLDRRARRTLAGALAWTAALAVGCNEDGGITLGLPFASEVEVVSGSGQSVAVGSPAGQPFVVRVLDQSENPMVGAAVTFAIASGGGSLSATRTTTDSAGLASTTYTAGTTTGPATITATAAELSPVTFQATITPAVATPTTAVLAILGGNAQTVAPGARAAVPLTVRLTTTTGAPVVGTTVTFVIVSGGGSVSATTATTDASGNASTQYTAGSAAGRATITALAPGATPVTFSATIAAAPSGG